MERMKKTIKSYDGITTNDLEDKNVEIKINCKIKEVHYDTGEDKMILETSQGNFEFFRHSNNFEINFEGGETMIKEEIEQAVKESVNLYHRDCRTRLDHEFNGFRCPDCHRFVAQEEITSWKWG